MEKGKVIPTNPGAPVATGKELKNPPKLPATEAAVKQIQGEINDVEWERREMARNSANYDIYRTTKMVLREMAHIPKTRDTFDEDVDEFGCTHAEGYRLIDEFFGDDNDKDLEQEKKDPALDHTFTSEDNTKDEPVHGVDFVVKTKEEAVEQTPANNTAAQLTSLAPFLDMGQQQVDLEVVDTTKFRLPPRARPKDLETGQLSESLPKRKGTSTSNTDPKKRKKPSDEEEKRRAERVVSEASALISEIGKKYDVDKEITKATEGLCNKLSSMTPLTKPENNTKETTNSGTSSDGASPMRRRLRNLPSRQAKKGL